MRHARALAAAAWIVVSATSCAPTEAPSAASTPSASPPASGPPTSERASIAGGPRLVDPPFSDMGRLARRAVSDVEAVGLWDELTDHLFEIEISTVPGSAHIPEDGHLADAFNTLQLNEHGRGARCEIRFYAAAMHRDLRLQRDYHEHGLLSRKPPTRRQFWAAVLGHELAHCLPRRNGERIAEHWERLVLRGMRKHGLR